MYTGTKNLVYPVQLDGPPEQLTNEQLYQLTKDLHWLGHWPTPQTGSTLLIRYCGIREDVLSGWGCFR